MISKLEKEKSDSLTAIHNSLQAEKQVNECASLHMYLSELILVDNINQLLTWLLQSLSKFQVAFNEAVTKLSQNKDKVIEDLRAKEKDLLEQLSTDQGFYMFYCVKIYIFVAGNCFENELCWFESFKL